MAAELPSKFGFRRAASGTENRTIGGAWSIVPVAVIKNSSLPNAEPRQARGRAGDNAVCARLIKGVSGQVLERLRAADNDGCGRKSRCGGGVVRSCRVRLLQPALLVLVQQRKVSFKFFLLDSAGGPRRWCSSIQNSAGDFNGVKAICEKDQGVESCWSGVFHEVVEQGVSRREMCPRRSDLTLRAN
ncbi:uncharacterized protein BKA78DRAFT_143151 [Phyllosticta capitalensis]|uniref:uncharacterized protein n=1 Tax=Phyllosticta capitalensis TaxID=121624 RepID=UPI00312CF3BB